MAIQVQIRRGTTTQNNAFTGAVGELTVDTTKDTVVVHDGSTAGGFPLAKESQATTNVAVTGGTINNTSIGATTASTGAFTTLAYTGTLTGGTGVINIGSGQLYKDASGNVGIGTSSPLARLDVTGLSNTADTARIVINERANDSGATNFGLDFYRTYDTGGNDQLAGFIHVGRLGGNANTGMIFGVGDRNAVAERMRITSAGNVGIGTTSPASKLGVAGDITLGLSPGPGGSYGKLSWRYNNTVSTGAAGYIEVQQVSAGNSGYMVFATNNNTPDSAEATERMRITSAGNVGIGTSSPANKLDVVGVTTIARLQSTGVSQNAQLNLQSTVATWSVGQNITQSSTGNLEFYNGSLRMLLDSSGNVGIGTSAPDANLTVNGAASFAAGTAAAPSIARAGDLNTGIFFPAADTIAFAEGGAEAMRIADTGSLLINCSVPPSSTVSGISMGLSGPGATFNIANTITAGYQSVAFINGNGTVGTIITSGSATSFNTSSDYRLKHNIQPMTGALEKVAQLKPVTYKWNADDSQSQGFIAHELQEVVPECVTGEKDAVDAEGKPVYQGIDTSFLVATLTAALQEAVAKIAALEARLDAANL
jgi:hypothetical protein